VIVSYLVSTEYSSSLPVAVSATNMWISGLQLSYQLDRYKGTNVTGSGSNWTLTANTSTYYSPGSTATFYYGYN
jgi:hypothetical protein